MKKIGLFQKIDILYTKATKAIIGEKPIDSKATKSNINTKNTPPPQSKLEIFKTFTKNSIEKVKRVGLKKSILTIGEPKEKDVLYKEVVKREKQEAKEIVKKEKATLKAAKALEKEKKATNKKILTKKQTTSTQKTKVKKIATKKSITKKVIEKKTSTKDKKETPKKKVTAVKTTKTTPKKTLTKKTEAKKSITKKVLAKESPSKKTISKKPITKKDSPTKASTETKATTKKAPTKKPTTTKVKKDTTTKAAPRGAKKAAKIALYIEDIKKHYGEVDEAFVAVIVKNLGPSIYKRDAELVSCSDPKELDTVRKNFLMKKLGINASQGVLDAAIQDVCEELKTTRTKYRATFYYSLAKKFKKESVLS